jgi:hypothetical protein
LGFFMEKEGPSIATRVDTREQWERL